MNPKITACLTSCGRFNLLEETLDSFFATNQYPIDEFLLSEDSCDPSIIQKITDKYPQIKIFSDTVKRGQVYWIDYLYNEANNDYIFHMEDDWLFEYDNQYVDSSVTILENYPNIHQVWIRHQSDHNHNTVGETLHINGVEHRIVNREFCQWCGFSWNPALRRKSDYKKLFPDGFKAIGSEYDCNLYIANLGYTATMLVNTTCKHIGWDHHVFS